EYVENTGNAMVKLFWRRPGDVEESLIPMANLFPPDGFNGGTPGRPQPGGSGSASLAAPPGPQSGSMFASNPIRRELLNDERPELIG
ncbi:MAG: hypothetical protein RMJ35_10830, partial [Phycisphaerales bacterium]|nr:hypothetical protein [Phycisphaerales bacterium]